MKEKLYTIPLNDAVNAKDECPFCYIERKVEQDLMDFVLGSGSSYMESDVRAQTDSTGFCRAHFKKMFDYGNTLGNAWILKTHMQRTNSELHQAIAKYKPGSQTPSFMRKKSDVGAANSVAEMLRAKENSCFICNQFDDHFARYLDTFMELYQKDAIFHEKIDQSKGFCLPHFADLCEAASTSLNEKQQIAFFPPLFRLMENNMDRLYGDVSWLIEKFDYRNKDADWKNSKEALQNCMQKLEGGYPADPVYKQKK